ncbi:hypothetical protein [Streptomyces sp. SID12501]|nr:hypothetical protein [Streptomyces sp. SID12501]
MAALRKANTPVLVGTMTTMTMSTSHGRTLSPEELKIGETKAG